MYQMLAGGLPFKADTSMEWILAHLQTPPRPIREFRPDLELPQELVSTVMMCLEKDPACRPQTAAELIDYLERARIRCESLFIFSSTAADKRLAVEPIGRSEGNE